LKILNFTVHLFVIVESHISIFSWLNMIFISGNCFEVKIQVHQYVNLYIANPYLCLTNYTRSKRYCLLFFISIYSGQTPTATPSNYFFQVFPFLERRSTMLNWAPIKIPVSRYFRITKITDLSGGPSSFFILHSRIANKFNWEDRCFYGNFVPKNRKITPNSY
jgi:hypothetical protein